MGELCGAAVWPRRRLAEDLLVCDHLTWGGALVARTCTPEAEQLCTGIRGSSGLPGLAPALGGLLPWEGQRRSMKCCSCAQSQQQSIVGGRCSLKQRRTTMGGPAQRGTHGAMPDGGPTAWPKPLGTQTRHQRQLDRDFSVLPVQ